MPTNALPLTPGQMLAARQVLGWPCERLALMNVADAFWRSNDLEGLRLIRAALECAGVEFVGAVGARLREAES